MSKLNKLKLSGTTYELQDLSAQPLLSAGTGIQISGNVISCTGGGGGNPTVELTQAEYDALVSAGTVSQNTYYIITDAQEIDTTNYWTSAQTQSAITAAVSGKADTTAVTQSLAAKQDTLISGTNIKTVNNESLLGSGNIAIQGGGKAIEGGRGITVTTGETADTVSFNLPISAGTSNGVIIGSGSASYNGLVHGIASTANGIYSNVFAYISTGSGNYSITAGGYLQNPKEFGAAFGQYNTTSPYNPIFSVGNGTSNSNRHNAFQILDNGDIYISSGGTDIKLQDNLGGGTVDTSLDSGSTNPVANSAITTALSGKQDTLVSGTNIKTINNESILGSGNITIQGGGMTSGEVQTMIDASVSGKVDTSSVVTAVTSASTDSQIPSAKAVYDAIPTGGTSITIDPTLDSGSTNPVSNSAITASLNDKAGKSQVFSSHSFGEVNNAPYIRFNDVNNNKKGSDIYYPKINNKGILTTNGTWAKNNLNFSLVETSAVTSSVTSASTDNEIPTAKAVYDAIPTASSAITSGDTNAVAGGAVYTQLGGLKLLQITQADYDALVQGGTVDSSTLYIITNVVS